jgi:hypothetical protein
MSAPVEAVGEWLYLFSSNQSPQYRQDIIDVLAAPAGTHYTFRYDDIYVEQSTAQKWRALSSMRVLVVFSEQDPKEQTARFLPVRLATVVEADVLGSRYFVRFRLEDIVALQTNDDSAIADFNAELVHHSIESPYESSASLGSPLDMTTLASGQDQELAFERVAELLSSTVTYKSFVLFRVRRLRDIRDDASVDAAADGLFTLTSDRGYELDIVQSQIHTPIEPRRFLVETDGVSLQVVGREGFEVASRYDRVAIPVFATQAPSPLQQRRTVIEIGPTDAVEGPHVRIRVLVKPQGKRAVAIAFGQFVGLLAVAAAGGVTGFPDWLRVAIALGGASLAAALQLLTGSAALKPPTIPWPKPTPGPHAAPEQGAGVPPHVPQ